MNKRVLLLLSAPWLLLAPAVVSAQARPCPTLEAKVADARFQPGQIWSYRTRSAEPGSTLTILQVDRLEKVGLVIHVRVDGLRMHNPHGGLLPSIEHMPFTRDALMASVTTMERTETKLPAFEGYDRWRTDCGGVYSISVAEAVDVAEKTLNAP